MTRAKQRPYRAAGWSEEQMAKLKRLYGEGLSFALIARQIPGKTRNACIGQAHRMGLKGRKAPDKKIKQERRGVPKKPVTLAGEQKTKAAPKKDEHSEKPIEAPETPPVELVVVHSSPQPRGIPDAVLACDDHHCRFPSGDVGDEDFHFCMAPIAKEDGPYCKEHQVSAPYVRPKRKAGRDRWTPQQEKIWGANAV
ncbi:hypothetical protein QMT40_001807 [Parvibaculaceae bacterium PLY_AMNH_Bact1]|nr:hypothetical protein QMT40_001807 [Parvibaculaceae bacterium PLY_AMNH_Bact1]